eukprot:CAMPEP_0194041626 /NCGR_PEP_ID=MMETSP0009_2-20130614/13509_1 /TAXON_ID=210454 /ORGANISM="Grammatophora oceanica, Strain CCMP 410" /LENGTH=141 /DNA_ID=CAMNT_0038685199 /DNA_START=130 /DNA_END=554 /DNA_ORIENTATION=+
MDPISDGTNYDLDRKILEVPAAISRCVSGRDFADELNDALSLKAVDVDGTAASTVVVGTSSPAKFYQTLGSFAACLEDDIDDVNKGEDPIEGLPVAIIESDGTVVAVTAPGANRCYESLDLTPGICSVMPTNLPGFAVLQM